MIFVPFIALVRVSYGPEGEKPGAFSFISSGVKKLATMKHAHDELGGRRGLGGRRSRDTAGSGRRRSSNPR